MTGASASAEASKQIQKKREEEFIAAIMSQRTRIETAELAMKKMRKELGRLEKLTAQEFWEECYT